MHHFISFMIIASNEVTEDILKYCAGVADGDGCIHASAPHTLKFSITQATPGKKVIDFFNKVFSGGLISHRKRDIKWDEQWEITYNGSKAVEICKKLAPFAVIKKDQLVQATNWNSFHRRVKVEIPNSKPLLFPNVKACEQAMGVGIDTIAAYLRGSKNIPRKIKDYTITYIDPVKSMKDISDQRQDIADFLERAKKTEHLPIQDRICIPYAAGFLDAEGHFEAVTKNSIRISAKQKYRAICDAFEATFGGYVTFFQKENQILYFQWTLSRRARAFLSQISIFLVGKAQQSHLLLDMAQDSGPQVKKELSKLNGWQKGAKRTVIKSEVVLQEN